MSQDAKPQKSTALIAIAIAVILALLLVGLGYAAYEASDLDGTIKKPVSKNEESDTDAGLPAANQPVTSDEINQQIDQLSEDFSKSDSESIDFSDDELSDQALGL